MWFVGDDWAEDHHDVEVQDASGRRLARARLAEGVEGIGRLHELIVGVLGDEGDPGQVSVGIETDRGPWVTALVAAGYRVFAINPRQVARYRERHGTSGAKSDAGDAHTLADMVRTDAHQLRPVAGDSPLAEGIKVITRAHQNLIWDRHRQMLRLRASLREFFPAALEAFADLTAPDALELLAAAPDPDRAARLSRSKIAAALKRARRRDVEGKAEALQAVLRSAQLRQPAELTGAYAVTVRSQVAVIAALNAQIAALGEQVGAHFGRHPDAEIYRSQPGLGPDFRRPWADAGLLTDVAAGRPPHALARHVGTRPPHVACAHVGVSQPAGEKRPSARTPAGPGPRRSVAARPIAQARTRSRLICERGACAYQLRKPGRRPARRPGTRRVRRRPRPLRRRPGPEELRRSGANHPRLGQETCGARPTRPQPAARRCAAPAGVLRAECLTRRPDLLRPAPRPRCRPSRRPAPAQQPAGRHPAWLPQDRPPLRRDHRLGTPQPRSVRRRLTSAPHGMSDGPQRGFPSRARRRGSPGSEWR